MLIWLQTLLVSKCSVSSDSSKVSYSYQIQYTGHCKIKSTFVFRNIFFHIKLSPILPFSSSKNGNIILDVWNPSSAHSINTKCFLLLHTQMVQRGNLKVLTEKFNLQGCLCYSKTVIYSTYVSESLWSQYLCIGIWAKTFIGKLGQLSREENNFIVTIIVWVYSIKTRGGNMSMPLWDLMCDSEIRVSSVLFQVYFASGRSRICFSPECLFCSCTLTTCSVSCSTLDY